MLTNTVIAAIALAGAAFAAPAPGDRVPAPMIGPYMSVALAFNNGTMGYYRQVATGYGKTVPGAIVTNIVRTSPDHLTDDCAREARKLDLQNYAVLQDSVDGKSFSCVVTAEPITADSLSVDDETVGHAWAYNLNERHSSA